MKYTLLKLEFKKAFDSKLFWITLAIGVLIASAAAYIGIARYRFHLATIVQRQSYYGNEVISNPDLAQISVFNQWIGQNYNNMWITMFYTLLPIFASLSFGWSYYSEKTSGYVKNIFTRANKKDYFFAKYVAVFILGAFVVIIPMLVNLMLVSSFVPAYKPDLFYDVYYAASPENFGSALFYEHPWGFVGLRFLEAGISGGLVACCSVAVSFFVKNKFAVLLLPFLTLVSISYIADMLMIYISPEISPIRFIHGGSTGFVLSWIVIMYAVVTFILSFGITMWRGVKDDVF